MLSKEAKAKKLKAGGLSVGAILAVVFLISPWEGEVKDKQGMHVAYRDPVGIITYCRGLTGKTLTGQIVKTGDKFTEDECAIEEVSRVKGFETKILNLVKPFNSPSVTVDSRFVSQYEKAALISFTFNVGSGNLATSTLLKYLNKGNHKAACKELVRWVYANKQKLPGLVHRRGEEKEWCLGNVDWQVESFTEKLEAPESRLRG